jgi:probable phosphoglycerate mutase
MRDDFSVPAVDAPTTLYLVRHGETEYNRRDIVQGGGVDSTLNSTGRAQAEALAQRLESVPIDSLYASTLQRAKQTANILVRPHEPLFRTHLRDLREMNWGVLEGEPPSETRDASMSALKAKWQEGAYDRAVDGGESIRDVQARVRRALRHILARDAGRTILVVTHGRYLRVLLATLLDDCGLEHMQEFGHSNTCVNRVIHEDGRARADLLNCTAHLSAEASALA